MSTIRIAILGAGGFAREVAWALAGARTHASSTACGDRFEVIAFVDREPRTELLKGLPVVALEGLERDVRLICGIGGMPEIKERVVADALARGFRFAPPAIAESARIGPAVEIGEGTIVCAGTIVTTDVWIGSHVALNLDCTIGHDAQIEDFATLSPGAHVSGHVRLGRGSYIGTGACIIEGVCIGDRAVLGAGAVATRDVPDWALAVGVPASLKKERRELVCELPREERLEAGRRR